MQAFSASSSSVSGSEKCASMYSRTVLAGEGENTDSSQSVKNCSPAAPRVMMLPSFRQVSKRALWAALKWGEAVKRK